MQFDPDRVPIMNEAGKMRTPTWVYEDKSEYGQFYTVCTAPHTYRHFTDETLPVEVKGLLAMVKAFPLETRRVKDTWPMQCYVPPDPRLADIGWQVNDIEYILILEKELLRKIFNNGRHT